MYSYWASLSLKHSEQVGNNGINVDTDLNLENHQNLRAFISQLDSQKLNPSFYLTVLMFCFYCCVAIFCLSL